MNLQAPPKLTPREREILPFLLSGATRKEIAVTLAVSPETIKIHVKNPLDKFGAITVRDAFEDLNNYQRFYGNGGLDFGIFNLNIEVNFELLSNRRDARVHRKQLFQAINKPVSQFVRRFYAGKGDVELHYEDSRIHIAEVTEESGGKFYRMHIDPEIEVGDTFQIDEYLNWIGALDPLKDFDIVRFDTPFCFRKMSYVFPENDPPKEISYETRVGFTETRLVGIKETRTPNSLVLEFSEYEQGSALKVIWSY